MFRIFIILYLTVFLALGESRDAPEVKIKQGLLRGKFWKSRNGRTFSGFSGIPYAKPPVDDFRFKSPVPADKWKGVLNASEAHAVCPQISIYIKNNPVIGNEDCLYLNVYTPQVSDNQLLPVMFYIHGGSFILGSARHDWLGPEVLLDKNIVLVTINYRLGALGFLSTADDVLPGNNGLKDQNMALRWVKDNIVHFGGHPERITIFGNSAGSVSTHYHMFSPLSKGLINGAIVQSGSALASFATASGDEAIEKAQKLGTFVNCSTATNRELVNCLKKVDAYELVRQEHQFASWDNDSTIPFRPLVEANPNGAFLTEHPLEVLISGKAAPVPLMTGIVAQETAYKTADLDAKPKLLKTLDRFFDMIIPPSFGITSDQENSSKKVRKFYFGDKAIDNSTLNEVTEMYTDGWFSFNNDVAVQLHFKYSTKPVYQYFFNYRGSTSYSTLFGNSDYDYGVSHTDELLYLFTLGMTFPEYVPTSTDIKVSEVMTTLWSNFARTGNPTPVDDSEIYTKWTPVRTSNLEYYNIKNYSDLGMGECLYSDRIKLWRSLPIGVLANANLL